MNALTYFHQIMKDDEMDILEIIFLKDALNRELLRLRKSSKLIKLKQKHKVK